MSALDVPTDNVDDGSERSAELLAGKFKFLIGHPEQFIDPQTLGVFKRAKWNDAVRHIVVDEAHCVVSWGESFRPKYRELDQLGAIFPHAAIIALTATATQRMQREIIRLLGMRNAQIITSPTDRPNIKYLVKRRLSRGSTVEVSYSAIFTPLLEELKSQQLQFPKTIVYSGLKWCGYGHELGLKVMSESECASSGVSKRLAQFHAPLLPEVTSFLMYQ